MAIIVIDNGIDMAEMVVRLACCSGTVVSFR